MIRTPNLIPSKSTVKIQCICYTRENLKGLWKMNSMTGFVFDVVKTEQGVFSFSIRSLNHRYLDIYIKLPEILKIIEPDIRQLLQRHFKRGKIEFILKLSSNDFPMHDFSLNKPLLDKLSTVSKSLQQSMPHITIELTRLLNWPGVLIDSEGVSSTLHAQILQAAKTVITKLIAIRQKEGNQLKGYIQSMLNSIEAELKIIKTHKNQSIENQKKKLLSQLKQLKIELDDARFAQEVTLLAQKVDITEEIDRLETYLNEANKILQTSGQIGRRLDFLIQELNRETNTICSKSADVRITQSAIEVKVFIEQIREQAQNLE
jgi:uncharacterized protein (TIGR00255 family)